jgi:sec-independent protein translocase protein TatA
MGSFSLLHWLVVILLIVLLFGRGKISDLMGDVAKGIKSFRKGMSDEEAAAPPAQAPMATPAAEPGRITPNAQTIDATAQREQVKS